MFRQLLIYLLIPFLLFSEESITPYLTSECDSLSLIEGVVNAGNGKLVQIEKDISIQGSDPLDMIRYYDSGHHFNSELGYSVGDNFPTLLQFNPNRKKQQLALELRKGLNLVFNIKEYGKKQYRGEVDPKYYKRGYTNCCEAQLRGEPPINAMYVTGNSKKFILHLGNGGKRHYEYFGAGASTRYYRLVLEERPNGNLRHFSYCDDKTLPVKEIWTTNNDRSLTLNSLHFTHENKKITIEASNGQKVEYLLEVKKGVAAGGGIFANYRAEYKKRFMTDAKGDHIPSSHYDPVTHTKFVNTIFSINHVLGPDGHSLHVDYDNHEKVKKLYLSGNLLYTFDYHSDYTTVTDALGHQRKYDYKDYRLQSVREAHRGELFSWNKIGQLESHRIIDPNKREIVKKSYTYDSKGNISRVEVKGNIAQKDSNDLYYIRYTHTQDDRNLTLSENHNDEREITYAYYPNTNLISTKHTYADQMFVEKEEFHYDKNGILITKIFEDFSGTQLITEIEPQLDPNQAGLTLPKTIKEFYVDASGAKHLLKKTEKTYILGDLLAEEKIFDAQENYRYSLYYAYNSQRKLIKSINAIGETTLFAYDANHNKTYEEKVGSGKKTFFIYDTSNRLIQEIAEHADGNTFKTVYTYDPKGNLLSSKDHFGQITTYQYDISSREIAKTDPLGSIEQKAYDTLNHLIEVTDKDGYKTKTTNNIYGSPLEIQYPDGTKKRYAYNLQGHCIQEWEKDGTYTTFQVDYLGRTKIENTFSKEGNLLKSLQYVYKGKNLVSKTDGIGNKTLYTYDGAGRMISSAQGDEVTTYTYDTLGRQSEIIKSNLITCLEYDYLDRVIQKTVAQTKEEYVYDIHGNRTIERIYSDSNTFSEKITRYNSHHLPEEMIDPLGNKTKILYEFTDHLKRTTVDPLGRSVTESFDPLNRLKSTKIVSPFGSLLAETTFSYDGRGNKTHQKEKIIAGTHLTDFNIYYTYDAMGQKIKQNEQNEKVTCFTYLYGRLEAITNPDGVVMTHHYDPLGRLSEQLSSDGSIHHRFSYDLNDNVIMAEDLIKHTTTRRNYDFKDRQIYERQASGFEIFFSYDAHNNLREVNFDNNKIVYSYDPLYLTAISRYKEGELKYSYSQESDLRGRPLVKRFQNGFWMRYQWDKMGRCSAINSDAYSQTLEYDPAGNLIETSITDPVGSYITRFAYDDLNQLTQESGLFQNDYTNDSINNRRSKNNHTCNINSLNQLISDTVDAFSYDPNGRRSRKNAIRYTYDALGRLTSYGDSTYHYDPFGRLIQKNSEVYKYQFDTEIGSQNQFRLVLGKGSTFAFEVDEKVYFPIRNHRGDITVIFDSKNNPITTYRYDAFGLFTETGSSKSPWLFSSQRYDLDTNLYHYDKREYDPSQGRWLTPDPLDFLDGPNLYAYVKNNPLIYVDPYGLWKEELRDFTCGAARGAADDMSFGLTSAAMGEYRSPSTFATVGYYTGTVASVTAGALSGVAAFKVARGIYSFFKGGSAVSNAVKAGRAVNQTHKVAKLGYESTTNASKTAIKINSEFGILGTKSLSESVSTSSISSIRLNHKLIAEEIAGGHAFEKHVLFKGEFLGIIRTRKQFADHIESIINKPSDYKALNLNREAYWDHNTGTVVIRNPSAKDGGTAFRPTENKAYFDRL